MNSLKTIFARLTNNSSAISALESIGISIKDVNDQLRPTEDILDELGKKFNSLNSEQQQTVLNGVGGIYQQNRLAALLANYESISVKAAETASNSFGSSTQEQLRYADSLEARLAKLQNKFTELSIVAGEMVISDGIIGATEVFGDLLQTASAVTEKIGFIPVVFGTAAASVVLLSKNVRGLSTAILFNNASLAGSAGATAGFTAGMSRAAMATNVLKAALRGLAASTLVGVAFVGLGIAVEKLINHFADAKQKQQEFEQMQNTTVESLTVNKKQTEELLKTYEKLNKVKAEGNLNSEQEEEYYRVMNQIGIIMPGLIDHIDSQNRTVLKSGEAYEQATEYAKKLVVQKKKLQQLEAAENINESINTTGDLESDIKKLDRKINHTVGISGVNISEIDKEKFRTEKLALENSLAEQQMKIREEVQKTVDSYFTDITVDTSITAKVNEVINSLDFSNASGEELSAFAKKVSDAMMQMQQAAESNDVDAYNNANDGLNNLLTSYNVAEGGSRNLVLTFESVKNSMIGVTDAATEQKIIYDENGDAINEMEEDLSSLSDKLKEAGDDFEKVKAIILETTKAGDYQAAILASMQEGYDSLSSEISPLNGLLESLAEGKSITSDEAIKLMRDVDGLSGAISVESGQIKINKEAVLKLRDAKVASYKQMIDAQKREVQAQSKGLKTKLKNFGVEINGILSVAQANEALAKATEERNKKMNEINNSDSPGAMHASTVVQNQYNSVASGINDIKSAYEELDKLSAIASVGLTQVGTSAESSSNSTEKNTYVTDKYKQKLEELNLELAKINKLKNEYPQRSKEYQNAIKQEIKLKQQQLQLMKDEEASLNKQIKSGNIQSTGKVTTSTTPSSTTNNYASGSSTEASVWNFFKSKGFSDSATAGIMGNLRQESGFSTTAVNKSSGATGIAQWLGGRLSGLKNFAGSQGTSYTNLNTQLEWLWKELNGADVTTKSIINKNGGMNAFMNMGVNDAALLFEKAFERSGGDALANRQKYANDIYVKYAGTTATGSSSSSSDGQQAIDQAKSDVLSMQEQALQIQDEINQLNMELVNSVIAGFDYEKAKLDDDLAQIDLTQAYETEGSKKWVEQQLKKEKLLRQQLDFDKQAVKYLNEQIKSNKALTAAQKAQLEDDLLQRTQTMISLERQLLDERTSMADKIVDAYKQSAEALKDAQLKSIDDMINAINEEDATEDYEKNLKKAQDERQKILDDIAKYSLDDSYAGQAKLKQLQEDLADADENISDMQSDHAKEQRINNLNEQKDSIQKEFDNLVNDERKFAQMRSDIINGNASQISKDLDKYFTNIKTNANVMGQSLSNNLIDLINQANRYLNGKDYKPIKIASAREGGITPSWGSNGKMMMVHEDEMISTKHDTKNLLSAMDGAKGLVDTIRNLGVGKSLASSAMSNLTSFVKPAIPSLSPTASTVGDTYHNTITIDYKGSGTREEADKFGANVTNFMKNKGIKFKK